MSRPVALVTGASVGIGEAFAREPAARGHDLVLVARDQERLEALAKELDAVGAKAEVLPADLTDAAQLATVEQRVTSVDVLVNNAGFGTFGEFRERDLDGEQREINLNVVALTRLTHAALGPMVERGKGGILNVSSIAGFQAGPYNATYSATKAYVTSFTQAVHQECKGSGVNVTVLCPGFTRTEFQVRSGAQAEKVPSFAWQTADVVAKAGLDALAKNKALIIPGVLNRVTGTFSSMSPQGVTRRLSGMVMRQGVDAPAS